MGRKLEKVTEEFQAFQKQKEGNNTGHSGSPKWLMIIILLFILASGYNIFHSYNSHYEGNKIYKKLEQEVVYKKPEQGGIGKKKKGIIQEIEASRDEKAPIKVDFTALDEKNSDIIAWIYIEALDLSYPVLQSSDNEYYLHRTVDETYNFAGSVFMDAENDRDFNDSNSIIYGHNMADGSMFGRLKEFNQNDAYQRSPYIWILTNQGDYRYEIFSTQVVTVSSECYTLFDNEDSDYLEFLHRMRMNSNIETSIREFGITDKVLTLSTCAGDGNDSDRYIVQAVR